MVKEAEKNAKEDELILKKIQAKNNLESTCYNLKNQLRDDKFKQ